MGWKIFVNDVVTRFENPETRDVQDLFNKLRQMTTVPDYDDKFEELRYLVVQKNKGLSEDYFISSFISGLKDHIKTAVRMFRPQTFNDAVFLAKQEETRTSKSAGISAKTFSTKASTTTVLPVGESKSQTSFGQSQVKEFKKGWSTLSSKEILERREKGQCFHCDDPYHPGQNCKAKLYALLGGEQEGEVSLEVTKLVDDMEQLLSKPEILGEISLNALSGNRTNSTLRLQGNINGKRVNLLINSGSTHSFVDAKRVK